MQKAYGMGIASVPYEELDEENADGQSSIKKGEIYNFGVYKYGKNNKSVKCILQIDCQEEILCLLNRGQKQQSYTFDSVKGVDSVDDSTRLFIQFNDATELEIDAGSFEEKNRISRLILMIVGQMQYGLSAVHSDSLNERRKNIIKEGVLDKKGRSAAFLIWPKRYVRVIPGEIMYFKVGDESDESAALSMISLSPSETFVRKLEDNGFVLITNKKEYTFRLNRHGENVEKDRDDWIIAIQEAAKPQYELKTEQGSPGDIALQQENYLKSAVRSLNEELEQLGVILNIIDAPIRASTQVKKVREIVQSLNNQIHTGLLSWTIRSAMQKQDDRKQEFTSPTTSKPIYLDSIHNTYDISPGSLPPPYSNIGTQLEHFSGNQPSTYSHLEEERSMHPNHSNGSYNILNLGGTLPGIRSGNLNEQTSPNMYTIDPSFVGPGSSHGNMHPSNSSYGAIGPDTVKMTFPTTSGDDRREESQMSVPAFPNYAKVNKKRANRNNDPYSKVSIDALSPSEEGGQPPPLPPKMFADEDYIKSCEKNLDTIKENTSVSEKGENMPVELPVQPCVGNIPPPPPPPPPPGFISLKLPPKEEIIPNCKMKPLFWSKVADKQVNNSIWMNAEDRMGQFSTAKLENLFNLGQQVSIQQDKIAAPAEVKPSAKSLLDTKKAQNLGIFLSGFKLIDIDIEAKLTVLDEVDGLTSEHIVALKRFKPSVEELEMYKSYKGDIEKMVSVDQFMMKLCKIPELGNQLDILLTVRELPDGFKGIETPIHNLLTACQTLNENNNFVRLLEYVLAVGNYVNGGTNRGGAYGFKLSTLVKLVEVRSVDKKHTLLQYLTEELYEKDPDALMCYKEMSALLLPMDASHKGLIAEVEIMKKDLEHLSKNLKGLAKVLDLEFSKSVSEFVSTYTSKLVRLEDQCLKINELISLLKKRFGESPASDFETWINHIGDFLKQLQRATESVEQKKKKLTNKMVR